MAAVDLPPLWLTERPAIIRPAGLLRLRPAILDHAFIPGMSVVGVMAGSMKAPAVVTRATSTPAGASLACSLPASLVSGNLIVLAVSYYNAGITLATPPSGWTLLVAQTATTQHQYIFYKTSNGSEGATVTVTPSGSTGCGTVAYQVSGWSGTPVAGTYATGTSTAPDSPSVTPGGSASLSLAIAGGGNGASTETISSYPSGYSNGQIAALASGSFHWCAGAEKILNSGAAENPAAFTAGNSSAWSAQTVNISGI